MNHESQQYILIPRFEHGEITFPFHRAELNQMYGQSPEVIGECIRQGKLVATIKSTCRLEAEFCFFNFYDLMILEILLDTESVFASIFQNDINLLDLCIDQFAFEQEAETSSIGLFNLSSFYTEVDYIFAEHCTDVTSRRLVKSLGNLIIMSAFKVLEKTGNHLNEKYKSSSMQPKTKALDVGEYPNNRRPMAFHISVSMRSQFQSTSRFMDINKDHPRLLSIQAAGTSHHVY